MSVETMGSEEAHINIHGGNNIILLKLKRRWEGPSSFTLGVINVCEPKCERKCEVGGGCSRASLEGGGVTGHQKAIATS